MRSLALTLGIAISTMVFHAAPVAAGDLDVKGGALVTTVLEGQVGKRVTLMLDSGTEITGTLKTALPHVVQLHAVAGKEFFDAVIDVKKIEGVLIRTTDE